MSKAKNARYSETIKPNRLIGSLALALSLPLVVAACSSSPKAPAPKAASNSAATFVPVTHNGAPTITMQNFSFSPGTISVTPGEVIKLVNKDSAPHTVTSDAGVAAKDSFDSGTVAGGSSGTVTAPMDPGTYTYHCKFHTFMHGSIKVT